MSSTYFDDMLGKATRRELTLIDLLSLSEVLLSAAQRIAIYNTWICNNPTDGLLYVAHFNLGVTLLNVGDVNGAKNAQENAIRINPEFLPPYLNLGLSYERLGLVDQAIASWGTAVNKLSLITAQNIEYKTMALKHIGRVHEARAELAAAEAILQQSAEVLSSQRDVIQHWVVMRQRQGKWPAVSALHAIPAETILKGLAPLSLGTYSDDALLQLTNAYSYNRQDVGWSSAISTAGPWATPETRRDDTLRIGYLSSDLRHHAIGFLMTEIFELHDRDKVHISVYDCGPEMRDQYQERMRENTQNWVEVRGIPDQQVACQILNDRIDILVDINGYTNFARTSMLSMRPAPIIVNWLGYPGTTGSPYHDYIIADDHIIPEQYELFYSERVARLPCYQPNNRHRFVSPTTPSRTELGLPEEGVVYCCFNGLQKITPVVFERWVTILQQVPGSVLWLINNAPEINERLKQAAAARGVAPERLIFAGWASNADHVARYRHADIVLDTWPYGAHTTGSDALWMGVPVVTLSGRSFASRVCGSLVRSAGIPELVCSTPQEYIDRAIMLGHDKEALKHYKAFLRENRDNCTLFDTPKLVRHLEALYSKMWDEYQSGTIPRPDLRNMDIYQEIGIDLHKTGVDLLNDEEYFQAYRRRLSYRHAFSPVPPDGRLWTPPEDA